MSRPVVRRGDVRHMTGLTPLNIVPGTRAVETAHVRVCEEKWSECPVCYTWVEELLQAVAEDRVEVPAETEQTELPV